MTSRSNWKPGLTHIGTKKQLFLDDGMVESVKHGAFVMNNLCRYVLKQGRWREFGITPFYVFAVLLVLLRIMMLIGFATAYNTRTAFG